MVYFPPQSNHTCLLAWSASSCNPTALDADSLTIVSTSNG
ncbi:uncharacterized protein G2W53_028259 [Senna tora]|uniref:Uncharacterized protein n=1 Tax=Senna tora TaxID=362788 RepID=A0A834T452_9FABA|nr:uncharacterized protein G2W53_028259 [Senna tora]